MKSNHGLRTTGTHTGNFGRAKVQAKRDTLDLTKEILTKDNLRIPSKESAFTRMQIAYDTTEDPKMKKVLGEMLRQRRATLHSQPNTNSHEDTTDDFWEMVRRTR
jgi:ribosomal protein S3AE